MVGILTKTFQGSKTTPPDQKSTTTPKVTGPGAGRAASSGQPSQVSVKQQDTVRSMQNIMTELSTSLSQLDKASQASGILNGKITASDLQKAAMTWGGTAIGGQKGAAAADGLWGPATKAALERIQQFVSQTGIQGVSISSGSGSNPHREMNDADIIKLAEENITNLGRLFQAVGLSTPDAAKGRGGAGFILDQVPNILTDASATSEDPWPENFGSVPVTVGDLRSFDRFFLLIQSLKYTECKPLQGADAKLPENKKSSKSEFEIAKLAKEILDGSIWSFGQARNQRSLESDIASQPGRAADAAGSSETYQDRRTEQKLRARTLEEAGTEYSKSRERNPAGPAENVSVTPASTVAPTATPTAVPVAEETGGAKYHCFYTIDDIFWWFDRRARMVYAQLYKLSLQDGDHPTRANSKITEQDLRAAQAYMAAIANLWNQWASIKPQVLDKINAKGESGVNNPKVTFDMIIGSGAAGSAEGPGAGRRADRRPGDVGVGGYTIPGGEYEDWAMKGPIQEFMPLEWLLRGGAFDGGAPAAELRNISQGGRLPDLNRRDWGGDWISIALANVDGEADTEKLSQFTKWARLVRDTIRELYVNWEEKYREKLDQAVLARQNQEWNRWNQVIRAIINRAQKGMASAMGNLEEANPDQTPFRQTPTGQQYAPAPVPVSETPETRAGRKAQKIKEQTARIRQREADRKARDKARKERAQAR